MEEYKEPNSENTYITLKETDQVIGEISIQPDYIRHQIDSIALSYWLGNRGYAMTTARVFSVNTNSQICSFQISPSTSYQKTHVTFEKCKILRKSEMCNETRH